VGIMKRPDLPEYFQLDGEEELSMYKERRDFVNNIFKWVSTRHPNRVSHILLGIKEVGKVFLL
jgi:hypothetical protein